MVWFILISLVFCLIFFNLGAKIQKYYEDFIIPYKMEAVKRKWKKRIVELKSSFGECEKIIKNECKKSLFDDFSKETLSYMINENDQKKMEEVVETIFEFKRETVWNEFNFDKKSNIRYAIQFEKTEQQLKEQKELQIIKMMKARLEKGNLFEKEKWLEKINSLEDKEKVTELQSFKDEKLVKVTPQLEVIDEKKEAEKSQDVDSLTPKLERRVHKSGNFKFDSNIKKDDKNEQLKLDLEKD